MKQSFLTVVLGATIVFYSYVQPVESQAPPLGLISPHYQIELGELQGLVTLTDCRPINTPKGESVIYCVLTNTYQGSGQWIYPFPIEIRGYDKQGQLLGAGPITRMPAYNVPTHVYLNFSKDSTVRLEVASTYADKPVPIEGRTARSVQGQPCCTSDYHHGDRAFDSKLRVIPGTFRVDLDSDSLRTDSSGDIWLGHKDQHTRELAPINGALIARISNHSYADVDIHVLLSLNYQEIGIRDRDAKPTLVPGDVLAVRTTEGNFAKMRIVRFRNSHDLDFAESTQLRERWKRLLRNRPANAKYHLEVEYTVYKSAHSVAPIEEKNFSISTAQYHELAKQAAKAQHFDKAVTYYEEAISRAEQVIGRPAKVALLLVELADVHKRQREIRTAIGRLMAARHLVQPLSHTDLIQQVGEHHHLLEPRIMRALAILYRDQSDYQLAAGFFNEAINILEPRTDTNGTARLSLVFNLVELGSVQYQLARYSDAEHTLQRARQAIATLMRPRPDLLDAIDKLETQVAQAARQQSARSGQGTVR